MSDPLLEQMRTILQLGPRASDASQTRGRRFSDADRPAVQLNQTSGRPSAILSRDGTRWLPEPDETSQRYRVSNPASTDADGGHQSTDTHPHICSTTNCSLSTVLETTELLELVLSFLDTSDVLELRRTSRHWDETIQQSPQLRLHFFTYAQWLRPGSDFQLLPLKLPGLSIERGEELHRGQWVAISLTPEAARRIVPHPKPSQRVRSRSIFEGLRGGLGSRAQISEDMWPASRSTPTINSTLQYEDLFVTQPPLLGMQVFLIMPFPSTSNENTGLNDEQQLEPSACAKVSCEAGVTLGFLAETVQSIVASSDAGPSNIEEVRIVFKAIMSFTEPQQARRKRASTRSVVRLN